MISAQQLAKDLNGDHYGYQVLAPCPVCQPQRRRDQRALSVRVGAGNRVLTYCHKSGCDFRKILDHLGLSAANSRFVNRETATCATPATEPVPTDAERTRRALEIWNKGAPIKDDDLAAQYLRSRGIHLDYAALDHVIQFNPETPWGRERVPALLVRMQTLPAMNTCGLQRIALTSDGAKIGKRMLGKAGYAFMSYDTCPGAAILTEGPEDALAALARYGLPVWCAMSAGGLTRLPALKHWHTVAVLADGDDAGRSAALELAHRWRAAGQTAYILDAPDGRDPSAMIEQVGHG